jgi:hypothetical protein
MNLGDVWCACRCDWLNNQNTIFGKIVGDTIYNMLRFNDLEVRPGFCEKQDVCVFWGGGVDSGDFLTAVCIKSTCLPVSAICTSYLVHTSCQHVR